MKWCIETLDGIRIYVGPHWETKPSLNPPWVWTSYSEALKFLSNLPHPQDLVVREAKWKRTQWED